MENDCSHRCPTTRPAESECQEVLIFPRGEGGSGTGGEADMLEDPGEPVRPGTAEADLDTGMSFTYTQRYRKGKAGLALRPHVVGLCRPAPEVTPTPRDLHSTDPEPLGPGPGRLLCSDVVSVKADELGTGRLAWRSSPRPLKG